MEMLVPVPLLAPVLIKQRHRLLQGFGKPPRPGRCIMLFPAWAAWLVFTCVGLGAGTPLASGSEPPAARASF